MKYSYYKEVLLEEHMLFAKELMVIYDVRNKNGELSPIITRNIIKNYCVEKGIDLEENQLYYKTKYGLAKVYPYALYDVALREAGYSVKQFYENQNKR